MNIASMIKLEILQFEGYQNIQAIDVTNSVIPQKLNDIIFSCPNLSRLNLHFDETTITTMPILLLVGMLV